jgi:MFS family permease
MIRTVEQATMRKVYLRVLPIAAASYFFCYLDRINVGFAALTMNKDLGLDAATFGFAAGIFFWGYFLFEVPSNIILEKLGARIWIARIMVTWGLLSGATAFCTGPYSFMTVRFLLGLAEAGFYPGLVLFFTQTGTVPALSRASPWRCLSRWRPARRFRPGSWNSTACWASPAGNGCTSSKQSRRSFSASSC